MDHLPISGADAERRTFNQLVAQYGEPAFARRARQVQEAFDQLLARCRQRRDELLEMVRLWLGTLHAQAGEWTVLRPWLADEGQPDVLRLLYAELCPRLRIPVAPTTSARRLRRGLAELLESIEHFNRNWLNHLQSVDLSHVNELRDGYNRWYLLEKECALRSPRLARAGFRTLELLTVAELTILLPPLQAPRPASA